MVNLVNFWTIEWSNSQKQFHVDRLDITLKRNIRAMSEGRATDYILIGLANSHEEAHAISRELEPLATGFEPLPIA